MALHKQLFCLLAMVSIISTSRDIQAHSNNTAAHQLVEITTDNFKQEVLDNQLPVIVKVSATWCRPCQKLAPILEEIVPSFPDLKFVSLDYDKNPEFIKKHNIDAVPTWMIYHKGSLVHRQQGCPPSKDALVEFIKGIDNNFKQK